MVSPASCQKVSADVPPEGENRAEKPSQPLSNFLNVTFGGYNPLLSFTR